MKLVLSILGTYRNSGPPSISSGFQQEGVGGILEPTCKLSSKWRVRQCLELQGILFVDIELMITNPHNMVQSEMNADTRSAIDDRTCQSR